MIELAFESGDVETVYQVIVATSVALSTVNCSQACASLNRQACTIAETCGDCLPGFAGVWGPSNDLCSSESDESRLISTALVKACANNCSSHGTCMHWDANGVQLPSRACTTDVWSCRAVCECEPDWFGVDCSWNVNTYSGVSVAARDADYLFTKLLRLRRWFVYERIS